MNFLVKSAMNIARSCAAIPRNSIGGNNSSLLRMCEGGIQGSIFGAARLGAVCLTNIMQGFTQMREGSTLSRIHRKGFFVKQKKKKSPLDGKPFAKGTVIKTIIRKPKKPNSANRKCVIVRLSTGKEMTAYVPGIGHNLQEHNVVLCKVGRLQDTPAVKIKCVRGKYDLPHVAKRQNK